MKLRIFISSVQKEFAEERRLLAEIISCRLLCVIFSCGVGYVLCIT